MAPVIRVWPVGNLANRMLQFMAARRLADLVPGAIVTGVHLPEWAGNRRPSIRLAHRKAPP